MPSTQGAPTGTQAPLVSQHPGHVAGEQANVPVHEPEVQLSPPQQSAVTAHVAPAGTQQSWVVGSQLSDVQQDTTEHADPACAQGTQVPRAHTVPGWVQVLFAQ